MSDTEILACTFTSTGIGRKPPSLEMRLPRKRDWTCGKFIQRDDVDSIIPARRRKVFVYDVRCSLPGREHDMRTDVVSTFYIVIKIGSTFDWFKRNYGFYLWLFSL
jgi:hypothetical protein